MSLGFRNERLAVYRMKVNRPKIWRARLGNYVLRQA
jgi:mRNA-degrading endonuclease RelE of RelBE toxin-antitoxin system